MQRILIADDDSAIRGMLRDYLEGEGIVVDLRRARDQLEIDQRELRLADAVGGNARRDLDDDEAAPVGDLGLGKQARQLLVEGLSVL